MRVADILAERSERLLRLLLAGGERVVCVPEQRHMRRGGALEQFLQQRRLDEVAVRFNDDHDAAVAGVAPQFAEPRRNVGQDLLASGRVELVPEDPHMRRA